MNQIKHLGGGGAGRPSATGLLRAFPSRRRPCRAGAFSRELYSAYSIFTQPRVHWPLPSLTYSFAYEDVDPAAVASLLQLAAQHSPYLSCAAAAPTPPVTRPDERRLPPEDEHGCCEQASFSLRDSLSSTTTTSSSSGSSAACSDRRSSSAGASTSSGQPCTSPNPSVLRRQFAYWLTGPSDPAHVRRLAKAWRHSLVTVAAFSSDPVHWPPASAGDDAIKAVEPRWQSVDYRVHGESGGGSSSSSSSSSSSMLAAVTSWRALSAGGQPAAPAAQQQLTLVGCARASGDDSLVATIYDVAVHPALQGRGLGGRLVSMLTQQLGRRGVYDVGLVAPPQLQAFFSRCSFGPDKDDTQFMIVGSGSSRSSSSAGSSSGLGGLPPPLRKPEAVILASVGHQQQLNSTAQQPQPEPPLTTGSSCGNQLEPRATLHLPRGSITAA